MNTKVLLIEDEPKAQQHVRNLMKNSGFALDIQACLTHVKESVGWLREHPMPELIIMDIQLADGLSFEILDEVPVDVPIIFTTAYDEYAIQAFKTTGIDYLLKPVTQDSMDRALKKFHRLYTEPKIDWAFKHLEVLQQYRLNQPPAYKDRFLLKSGNTMIPVMADQIAYFFRQEIVFAKTFDGTVFSHDASLGHLQTQLDPRQFVRLNRQLLTHVKAIHSLRGSKPGQLMVELQPAYFESIHISQERSSWLKRFLSGEV